MQLHQAVFLSAGGMALVMLAVLALLSPLRPPGVKDWLMANVAALSAYAFFGVGWDNGWRPAAEIANFLYACTAALVATGFQRSAGLRPRYAPLFIAAVILASALAYFHYVLDLPHVRFVAVSIFHFLPAFFVLVSIKSTPHSPYVRQPLRLAKALAWLVILTLSARVVSRIPLVLYGAGTPLGGDTFVIVLLCLGALLLPGLTLAGAAVSTSKILQSASLEARTDALTGLWTRRAFMAYVGRELDRAERLGSPLALLMIDVDNFKHINDTFGHSYGDGVLVRVAQACTATLRSIDYVCRLGGEEFAVLLPDTDAARALGVAERIRTALSSGTAGEVPFTVSVGVSDNGVNGSWSELFEGADGALYDAKAQGKNCCVVA